MQNELCSLTLGEVGPSIKSGRIRPTVLAEAYLHAIERLNPVVNAYVTVTAERALNDARRAERDMADGRWLGPLHGIPYALKDVYGTAGIATTANSVVLRGHVPVEDSHCAAALANAGGVLLGKLCTHEFAFGGPPGDLPFGAARNPWSLAHDTGGSSSGSGTAVAARLAPATLGTDTGGSIRQPVSFCGGAGMKPTHGRVSTRGVIPLSPSLDHCGPMAQTSEDCAILLQLIAGHDPASAGSAAVPVPDFRATLGRSVTGTRVGWLRSFYELAPDLDPAVREGMEAAVEIFRSLGCLVSDAAMPSPDLYTPCGRTILLSEAFALHREELAADPSRFGRWTRQRLLAGQQVLAADYIQALRMRRVLAAELDRVFDEVDVLLTTGARSLPGVLREQGEDWYWDYRSEVAFNLTGHPVLALCAGYSPTGMPIGMQLVGRAWDEATLFQMGHAYEGLTRWRQRKPPVCA